MNVLMDKLATLVAANSPPRAQQWKIQGLGIRTTRHGAKTIIGQVNQVLYENINAHALWTYFTTRVFNENILQEQVNWKAMAYARKRSTTGLLIFMSKWISNTVPTGRVMQRRKQRVFNRCPRCNHWGEDREHILRCWDIRANIIWKAGIKKLQQIMTMEDTHPEIGKFIMDGLNTYKRSSAPLRINHNNTWQTKQQQIGWMNFLTGFFSSTMVEVQQQYYRNNGSRKGGHIWAGKLTLQCWNLIHNMWVGRNEVLHRKEIINDISGAILLDLEVEKEYDLGYEGLPQVYHRWWTQTTKERLLDSSIEHKKGWLLIIKTLKESLQIAEYSIFSSSRPLRKWIGLSPG